MKYDFNYFHNELMLLRNGDYNKYAKANELTIFIYYLRDEVIYDYYEIDWKPWVKAIFKTKKDDSTGTITIVEDFLERLNCLLGCREVAIKLLLFLQRGCVPSLNRSNVSNFDYVEKKTAQLISENIEQSKKDEYHGGFSDMPKPNYYALIQNPNIFHEVTPIRKWKNEQTKKQEDSHICNFRFMDYRFMEDDNYRKRWLYQSPNSKFTFNYNEVALGIYELIQTTELVEYTKYIRTYIANHPNFNPHDANDREEFYNEVHTLVMYIVDGFFQYSDPGYCWGIRGEDYPDMCVEKLDDILEMEMWQLALNKVAGIDDTDTAKLSELQKTIDELRKEVAALKERNATLQRKIESSNPQTTQPVEKTEYEKQGMQEKSSFAQFFRSDLAQSQIDIIDKEIKVACRKRNAGVAIANVLCSTTNRETYLAIANVPHTDLHKALQESYGLQVKYRAFAKAMNDRL